MSADHSPETSPLYGLDQVFELEPRWGSPVFEVGDVLSLSDRKQAVCIQVTFADFSKALVGRAASSASDEPHTQDGEAEATISSVSREFRQHLLLLAAATDEEQQQAETLRNSDLPLIDLQPFNPDVFGVSRKHALLKRDGQHIVLTDLHSANGTRLNGTLLVPMQRYVIRNRDALQLGALQLRVRFSKSQME